MIKWFRKYFLPYEGNNHRPHFLRASNIQLLVVVILLVEVGLLAVPYIPTLSLVGNDYTAAVLPAILDDLSNQNRHDQNLPTLTVNPLLNKAAQLKAEDMASKSYFAHVSPEGKTPWYWFDLVGYKYVYAGENLAVDFTDSKDVDTAWMNSTTHRANIIKDAYTEMGTGVATGTYDGYPTVFVAQVYGRPVVSTPTNVPEKIVLNNTSTIKETSSSNSKVLGASVEAVVATTTPKVFTNSTTFQQFLTSPRHIANSIFIALGVLIILALLFKLFIKTDKFHPDLITNGLIILVILLAIYMINSYMTKSKFNTHTSFASFSEGHLDSTK